MPTLPHPRDAGGSNRLSHDFIACIEKAETDLVQGSLVSAIEVDTLEKDSPSGTAASRLC